MASPKKTSTQDFVLIKDIRDGVIILKDGQLCTILLASSINFALKSSDEQSAILSQFQSFINTIDFSLQIYIQSRKMDIAPYLEVLHSRKDSQYNDLMRIQLREYIEFIKEFTAEAEIMTKNFFVVIPYTPTILDVKKFRGLLGNKNTTFDEARFVENKNQLEQRVTVVEQGLARTGIHTVPLGTNEAIELFYHIYNPEDISSKAPSQQ